MREVLLIATAAFGRRAMTRAISGCTELIRADPRNTHAYVNRGLAYYLKHDLDHAIADFTKYIDLVPTDKSAYLYRGNMHMDHFRPWAGQPGGRSLTAMPWKLPRILTNS